MSHTRRFDEQRTRLPFVALLVFGDAHVVQRPCATWRVPQFLPDRQDLLELAGPACQVTFLKEDGRDSGTRFGLSRRKRCGLAQLSGGRVCVASFREASKSRERLPQPEVRSTAQGGWCLVRQRTQRVVA